MLSTHQRIDIDVGSRPFVEQKPGLGISLPVKWGMAEAPSMPYIREEAITSRQILTNPAHPPVLEEHNGPVNILNDDEEPEINSAPQYWTAKRHRGRKDRGQTEENYGEAASSSSGIRTAHP